MRRKKHLNERVERASSVFLQMQCRCENSLDTLDDSLFFDCNHVFGNDNPVHIEIGCGKGGFAIQSANKYPNINFIAIEKNQNVIITGAENIIKNPLPNLKFVIGEAENLNHLFKKGSAERIYLNFSCPYFKKSYFKNRLSHARFLKIYREVLIDNGEIHMKTDNQNLFEFSLEQFSQNGFQLHQISLNLHESEYVEEISNIMTEYESKFVGLGLPIYRCVAVNTVNKINPTT